MALALNAVGASVSFATGRWTSSTGKQVYYTLTAKLKSQDTINAVSVVEYSMVMNMTSGNSVASHWHKVYINNELAGSYDNAGGMVSNGQVVISGQKTVSHDNDGNASLKFKIQAVPYYSSDTETNRLTAENTITLNNIPRAGVLTVDTSATGHPYYANLLGGYQTIRVKNPNPNYYYMWTWYVGPGYSGTWNVLSKNSSGQFIDRQPLPIQNIMPGISGKATTVNVGFICRTYSDAAHTKQIGSQQSTNVTLGIPSNETTNPTMSASITDANNIAFNIGNVTYFVPGLSTYNISVSPSAKYQASIAATYIYINNTLYKGTSINGASVHAGDKIKIEAYDSRGFVCRQEIAIQTKEYIPSVITYSGLQRGFFSDGSWHENVTDGTTCRVAFTYDVSPSDFSKTTSTKLEYKDAKSSSYILLNGAPVTEGNEKVYYIDNLSYENGYDILLTVYDVVNSKVIGRSESFLKLSSGQCNIHVRNKGKGIGVGISVPSGFVGVNLPVNTHISGNLLLDVIYPVGSIFMCLEKDDILPNDMCPIQNTLGGIWERIKDRFILAAGDTYSVKSTGGEASHTLTINEMPSHTHSTGKANSAFSSGQNYNQTIMMERTDQLSSSTQSSGGGQPHNNMPPYLTAYMWKRVQ